MAREYPRIGSAGLRDKWAKKPATAPFCIAPGCTCRATHRPEVEVNWFRGDDEGSGPVCKAHSADPVKLLAWTAAWKAAQQKPTLGVGEVNRG